MTKPVSASALVLFISALGCSSDSTQDGAPLGPGTASGGGVSEPGGGPAAAGMPGSTADPTNPAGGAAAGGTSGSGGAAGEPSGGSGMGGNQAPGGGGAGGQGAGGGAGGDAAGGAGGAPAPEDEMPMFTFFTTSMPGLLSLAPDKENGFGGDLGGLEGADEICDTLAKQSNPTDSKVWRAFLSVASGADGNPVHAIDRIGPGPWHDFNGRLLANDLAGLVPDDGGRPSGGDGPLAEMFTDENGDVISTNTRQIDNHDMLTGSDREGRLDGGIENTCQDWTSSTEVPDDGVSIGHAWPRSAQNGRHWISEHKVRGCLPGINIMPGGGPTDDTVGSGGGYGGIYCFAVKQ